MKSKVLIIQTAFIGDVILATSLIEYLKSNFPESEIDFLCRKGNEGLLENNPHIGKVFIWNKNKNKFKNLVKVTLEVRRQKYDYVLNIQRFFNSGFITAFSGAKNKVGFDKNPLSLFFTKSIEHKIPHHLGGGFFHEVQRNAQLASIFQNQIPIPTDKKLKPMLYFSEEDHRSITDLNLPENYVVMAPSSVWYTKQWHIEKWKQLISKLSKDYQIYLIGAPSDNEYLKPLLTDNTINLAGKHNLRESALLMKEAKQVFVSDSAPLHLASSVNAKTTAIFCSTVPEFGYGPLSDQSRLIQVEPRLDCMPCGLHGHSQCPKNHFNCSNNIDVKEVANF